MAFIDLEKANDRVPRQEIWRFMKRILFIGAMQTWRRSR